MGQEIEKELFSDSDFARFSQRLHRETVALGAMFEDGAFCNDDPVGGFELEAWLVGEGGHPAPRNKEFLASLANPDVVPELSQFNFEINVQPCPLAGNALSLFSKSLNKNWSLCRQGAGKLGLDVMSVGIHPLLKDSQLVTRHMSEGRRYRALNEQILKLRNRVPIRLDISGRERLCTEHNDVMLEAATTSFQIHMQVRQDKAVDAYNAAQIVSAPLLAVGANSPYLFGVDLWDESRIPLFEQAVNIGNSGKQRVTLGESYVQHSLMECFDDNLHHYPVLIPAESSEPEQSLPYLRLHNGTIWRWNRPLLGFDQNGLAHLRIENRVLPAGPTVADMMANAAFFWGLVEYLLRNPQNPKDLMPFAAARHNFYQAARHGLNAEIKWLDDRSQPCAELILKELLPMAEEGLAHLSIAESDARHYLVIIEARARSRQNGASWQRAWVAENGRDMQQLSLAYLQNQHSARPVHEWEL